uniref:Pentatricopeptide repeat-containing protein n=1 Tax=Aegilops tauschii subsp. strangulata TaxID=200361 RepID=A0A453SM31_AEGTS
MPARGIVTWNSIVDGYVSTRALGSRAAGLLQEMHEVRHDRVGIIHHSCRLLPEIGVDGRAWAWRKTPRLAPLFLTCTASVVPLLLTKVAAMIEEVEGMLGMPMEHL